MSPSFCHASTPQAYAQTLLPAPPVSPSVLEGQSPEQVTKAAPGLPRRRMWRGKLTQALENRDRESERAVGRKQTQRPGTRTGCMPDTGPHWPEQWFVPVLGVRGALPGVRAAVASHSCNFRVQSPNLPSLPLRGSKLQEGTRPELQKKPKCSTSAGYPEMCTSDTNASATVRRAAD